MEENENTNNPKRFAFWINLLIIMAIAIVGIFIAYFFIAIFTKHGRETQVPGVENMSYTNAIELLHKEGFNVEIRDSLFRDDIKPGYVLEQFPRANSIVKPGRKIFLYINAVHPKEVVMDDGSNSGELALKDWSQRQVTARLAELGFKNVSILSVLGADDRVIKITANGKPVYKMQKIPVNAKVVIEVSDGRLTALRDSLYESERLKEIRNNQDFGQLPGDEVLDRTKKEQQREEQELHNYYEEPEYFEEPEFFYLNE